MHLSPSILHVDLERCMNSDTSQTGFGPIFTAVVAQNIGSLTTNLLAVLGIAPGL